MKETMSQSKASSPVTDDVIRLSCMLRVCNISVICPPARPRTAAIQRTDVCFCSDYFSPPLHHRTRSVLDVVLQVDIKQMNQSVNEHCIIYSSRQRFGGFVLFVLSRANQNVTM